MIRTLQRVICLSLLTALASRAQSPAFEVASVKQNLSQAGSSSMGTSTGRFVATNVPLRFLILDAYDLLGHQLVNYPEWTTDRAYDIVGTYPEGRKPTEAEVRVMLQNLLVERFGLKLHREQRTLHAYDLVLAKPDKHLGPQLIPSPIDCVQWRAGKRPEGYTAPPSPVAPSGKRPVCGMITTRRYLTAGSKTIPDLTGSIQAMVAKPVVDKTGLTGPYDFDLQWEPTELHATEANTPTTEGPSIFTALEDQLGLKLIPHDEPFEVFAVEAIHPPEAN